MSDCHKEMVVPRTYSCLRCESPPDINGRVDAPAWQTTPWTEDFVDIQGDKRPTPRFRTRAKMMWDDTYFYVGAEMAEPHVNGTLTEKNCVIFHDNDFEVFIDPDGDNHNYYEFEMNALNTIWELTLPKPYRAGGQPVLGTNIEGLKSAVHIEGSLNDPSDTDRGWSVTIAFPWAGLMAYRGHMACPPRPGDQWRVNFSRVEWLFDIIEGAYRKIPKEVRAEDNWVWSPQGVIDMHRPWTWGVVEFCESVPEAVIIDPIVDAQLRLMTVYEAQRQRVQDGLLPTDCIADLNLPFTPENLTVTIDGETWFAEMPWLTQNGAHILCRVDNHQHFTWS